MTVGNHINDLIHNAANAAGDHLVQAEFTKMSRRQMPFDVVKGQLTTMRVRPEVINEQHPGGKKVQGVVTSTNIVGQIFKASQDNIISMYLTMQSADIADIDDFETYASDAELQAAWVASGGLATLDTTVMGSNSMKAPSGTVVGDTWTKTFAATDMTNFTGSFKFLQTAGYAGFKVRVFVGDGVYTQSAALPVVGADTKTTFNIDINSMTADDGVNLPNHAAITQIGFIVDEKSIGDFFYVDDVTSTPLPGSVEIKLWDMGDTLPVSGITSINDGTQYVSLGDLAFATPAASYILPLNGGRRLYHLHHFVAGVAQEVADNEILNVDNYYAVTLNYVDTNVSVYGSDPSKMVDRYTNGYAFQALSESAPLIAVGPYNDLMFAVFSTQDVWVNGVRAIADAAPNGGAEFHISIKDKNTKNSDVIHTHGIVVPQEAFIDLSLRPAFLEKGGKLVVSYGDDYSDDVSRVHISMSDAYEPPTVNG